VIPSRWLPSWLDQLGWVLIHFLWEGLAIGICAWVGLILLRNRSAESRYALFCLSLLTCGLSPFLTWAVLDQGSRIQLGSLIDAAPNLGVSSIPFVPLPSDLGNALWAENNVIQIALPYLVLAWCLGVICLCLRLVDGWRYLRKLRACGVPLSDQAWLDRLNKLADQMRVRQTVSLLESALVEVPTLLGWIHPIILVPSSFFTGLSPDQMEAILAHELAHVRRYDYLVNLVQIGIETLLFYHPVVWWLGRVIRQERENCCDDLALCVVGDKVIYASALATLEEGRSLPAMSMAVTGGSLLQRINRIAHGESRTISPLSLAAAFAVFFLSIIGWSYYQTNRDFTPWMSLSEMNRFLAQFDTNPPGQHPNYWDQGHWMNAVEARWHEGIPEYRIRYGPTPKGYSCSWFWYVNLDQASFSKHVHELADRGYVLLDPNSYLRPDNSLRYEGVWHRASPKKTSVVSQ
jgi:beta-lactamase regulating signal transducer with metallopeptidase domain